MTLKEFLKKGNTGTIKIPEEIENTEIFSTGKRIITRKGNKFYIVFVILGIVTYRVLTLLHFGGEE